MMLRSLTCWFGSLLLAIGILWVFGFFIYLECQFWSRDIYHLSRLSIDNPAKATVSYAVTEAPCSGVGFIYNTVSLDQDESNELARALGILTIKPWHQGNWSCARVDFELSNGRSIAILFRGKCHLGTPNGTAEVPPGFVAKLNELVSAHCHKDVDVLAMTKQ